MQLTSTLLREASPATSVAAKPAFKVISSKLPMKRWLQAKSRNPFRAWVKETTPQKATTENSSTYPTLLLGGGVVGVQFDFLVFSMKGKMGYHKWRSQGITSLPLFNIGSGGKIQKQILKKNTQKLQTLALLSYLRAWGSRNDNDVPSASGWAVLPALAAGKHPRTCWRTGSGCPGAGGSPALQTRFLFWVRS